MCRIALGESYGAVARPVGSVTTGKSDCSRNNTSDSSVIEQRGGAQTVRYAVFAIGFSQRLLPDLWASQHAQDLAVDVAVVFAADHRHRRLQ